MSWFLYKDRKEAGEYLARVLRTSYLENPVIFGIPRGGAVVAKEVARELKAPLDVAVVRKLGAPFDPEVAFGAIAPGGILALEHELYERLALSTVEVQSIREAEEAEMIRRIKEYRGTEEMLNLTDLTAIIIDDGVATGSTALAAIRYVKKLNPAHLIFAAPVCAPETVGKIKAEAELICLESPEEFMAVGQFYENFPQITDKEVKDALNEL